MASNFLDLNSARNSHSRGRDKDASSMESPGRPASAGAPAMKFPPDPERERERSRGPKKLVLCFDGTGNKFHGDDSDSNILKIFRMLDRTADDQYHYYQPGIGTYIVSGSLSHTSMRARFNSWYQKAKDSAVGSSFDIHVVGGYRFLMRFYNPGDEIYIFGFSRGAYIARFLAEMIDHIGLLSHGNEEMVNFAWKAFAQWQSRGSINGSKETKAERTNQKRKMFRFMKGFRETFSRPVGRIQFLGLFDTVNSVPRFEAAWMQRSKFPYTARSSAKVIRHAVSVDERRAKFRQDLMYQGNNRSKHRRHRHLSDVLNHMMQPTEHEEKNAESDAEKSKEAAARGRRPSQFLSPTVEEGDSEDGADGQYKPYRARSKSQRRAYRGSRQFSNVDWETGSNISGIPMSEIDPDNEEEQDIDEVWFAGGHADVGGGWDALEDRKSSSHVPLAWIVREAMKAGLPFDMDKVAEMGCLYRAEDHLRQAGPPNGMQRRRSGNPDITVEDETRHPTTLLEPPTPGSNENGNCKTEGFLSDFHEMMHHAHTSIIHDSLEYGQGLGAMAVSLWKFMEYLPFRRMDLQPNGSWKPIRWPLPGGEVRDIPKNARIHGSVIRRMELDETYRPGNLIIGGGGRGVKKAPPEYGIGDWVCVAEHGDPIGEVWQRRDAKDDE